MLVCIAPHIFVAIICVQLTTGDMALNTITRNFTLHETTAKYINKAILLSVQRQGLNSEEGNIVGVILKLNRYSMSFVSYNNQLMKQTPLVCNVTLASGRFALVFNSDFNTETIDLFTKRKLTDSYHSMYVYIYTWSFSLDKNISSNITFKTIYFASSSEDCFGGNLAVYNSRSKQEAFIYLHHSTFSLYPKFNNINIDISVAESVFIILNATYSVLDIDLIINNPTVQHSESVKLLSNNLIRSEHLLSTYLIRVFRINSISPKYLNLQKHTIVVYDGPGFLSSIIKSDSGFYQTSTFQCIVQTVVQWDENNIIDFNYASHQLQNSQKITIPNKTFVTIPIYNCTLNVCVLFLNTRSDNKVNVTIINVTYVGVDFNRPNCYYGGLVTGEHFNGKYMESSAVCQPLDGSKRQSRSFYSYNSSLVIVLYWYKHYSAINATIEISQTRCEPIRINLCTANILCHYLHDTTQCDQYLQSIQNSHVRFDAESNHYLLSVQQNKCVALHFTDKGTNFSATHENDSDKRCHIQLYPDHFISPGKEVLFQVKASFNTFPFLASYTLVYLKNIIVAFYGVADEFCLMEGHQFMNCRKVNGSPFYKIEQSLYASFDAFMTAKLMTPIYSSFSMWIVSDLLLDEWLEIIIWNRECEDINRSSLRFHYLTEVILLQEENSLEKVGPLPEHILMLKLDGKVTSLNLNVGRDIRTYFLSTDLEIHLSLWWKSTIESWRLQNNAFISLHGKMQCVQFTVQYAGHYNKSSSLSMKAVWIYNAYDPYVKSSQAPSHPCIEKFSTSLIYDKCLNLSAVKSNDYMHYVLFTKILERKKSILKSWEEASQICKETGGRLPYFTSREELEELIALLKLSRVIKPIEAMFIGLSFNTESVSKLPL